MSAGSWDSGVIPSFSAEKLDQKSNAEILKEQLLSEQDAGTAAREPGLSSRLIPVWGKDSYGFDEDKQLGDSLAPGVLPSLEAAVDMGKFDETGGDAPGCRPFCSCSKSDKRSPNFSTWTIICVSI
jgi:hypothetical protein